MPTVDAPLEIYLVQPVPAEVAMRDVVCRPHASANAGASVSIHDTPLTNVGHGSAVSESAGVGRVSCFIEDTLALPSILGRHDMSRRPHRSRHAQIVVHHHLDEAEWLKTAVEVAAANSQRVSKP